MQCKMTQVLPINGQVDLGGARAAAGCLRWAKDKSTTAEQDRVAIHLGLNAFSWDFCEGIQAWQIRIAPSVCGHEVLGNAAGKGMGRGMRNAGCELCFGHRGVGVGGGGLACSVSQCSCLVKGQRIHTRQLLHHHHVFQERARPPQPSQRAAISEWNAQRQRARASHNQRSCECVPSQASPQVQVNARSNNGYCQNRRGENPRNAVDGIGDAYRVSLVKGLSIPKPRELGSRHRGVDAHVHRRASPPTSGFHSAAHLRRDRIAFAGDEAPVECTMPADNFSIRRQNFSIVNPDVVPGLQVANAHGFGAGCMQADDTHGEPALISALVREAVVGAVLVPFSDEQEKDQTSQRVKIPHPMPRQDVHRRTNENRRHADGYRDINVQPLVLHGLPRRHPVARSAVHHDWRGQQQGNPAEDHLILRSGEARGLDVVSQREQHDVSESEPSHRQPADDGPHLPPICLMSVSLKIRRIPKSGQVRGELTQRHDVHIQHNFQLFARQVNKRLGDAGQFAWQFFEKAHAGSAVHGGQEDGCFDPTADTACWTGVIGEV